MERGDTQQGIGALALSACPDRASAAGALTLADCARVTHISHAGEAAHRAISAKALWRGQLVEPRGVQENAAAG